MGFVAAIVAAAPMRAEPSHKSEMVSQMLFSEYGRVDEVQGDFTLVTSHFDNYKGWVQSSQLSAVPESMLSLPLKGYSFQPGVNVNFNGHPMPISMGTPIYNQNVTTIGEFSVGWQVDAKTFEFTPNNVLELSRKYLNVGYLWGGRSSFGIDCSGFVQQVYKMMGIKLSRDAYQQATDGENIGFLQEVVCGDLAFFDNQEGKITHVGILLNEKDIIHASGRVRIDNIDAQGIVNVETGKRTHRLRLIKRLVML